jgi:hypothetical protein
MARACYAASAAAEINELGQLITISVCCSSLLWSEMPVVHQLLSTLILNIYIHYAIIMV